MEVYLKLCEMSILKSLDSLIMKILRKESHNVEECIFDSETFLKIFSLL